MPWRYKSGKPMPSSAAVDIVKQISVVIGCDCRV